ncbi:hypothetical protein SABIM44S_00829 [Streptomyces abikoensis]
MPDQKSSFILTGMAVVLVLLLWWLIRAVARQGGFRRACRRVAWELRMTRRAFAAPFRARSLHRRRVRTLTSFLADPAVPALVDHALADAERVAGEGCRVPAAAVSTDRQRVAVVVAGRSPRPATAPWRDARDEPGDWTWSAGSAAVGAGAEAPPARRTLPLVLGVDRLSGATVVADWMCGPPAVSLEGDVRVVRSVLQALAAQLDLLAGGPVVRVAREVHPRFPGRELDRILDELEAGSSGAGDELPVVVVCWAPSAGRRERLAALCASGRVRALVGGRLPGHCWTLHAEPGGRLLGPGAGVDVESAALSRAVGSAVKRFRRRGTGWWTARDDQAPPTDPGGDGGAEALAPDSGPREEAGPGAPVPPATAEAVPSTPATTAPPAPATASLSGAESAVPPATGREPASGTAAAPAAPAPPAGGAAGAEPARGARAAAPAPPVPPAPGPRVDDFAEPEPAPGPESGAGRGGQPPTAAFGPPAPAPAPDAGGAVPGTAPGPVPRSWLEPEPEPGSGTGPRPAPGVSAARTHPDRTPEHP